MSEEQSGRQTINDPQCGSPKRSREEAWAWVDREFRKRGLAPPRPCQRAGLAQAYKEGRYR